jgi:hypothetical protein
MRDNGNSGTITVSNKREIKTPQYFLPMWAMPVIPVGTALRLSLSGLGWRGPAPGTMASGRRQCPCLQEKMRQEEDWTP